MLKPLLAILLGLGLGACGREPAPARPVAAPASLAAASVAPRPVASPITVTIELEAKGGSPSPLAQEWMRELQAVLHANPAQFSVMKAAKDAELNVRIERVEVPPDSPGHQMLTLWLSVGQGEAKRFTLDYTGGPEAMAGRLARYIVAHVHESRAAASKTPAPTK